MKKTLLELRHVFKTFSLDGNKLPVLKDINLKIGKNEFVAIMGPSGSGKSTLMYIVGCLDKPTSGQVILEGEDVSQFSEAKLAKIRNQKIGFVFQMYNLLPRTSALANVLLPIVYSNRPMTEAKKQSVALLEKLGMGDRIGHFPSQLSGGQQQRIAIARALINQPSILLADEPTGNLDSKSGQEILSIFKKLHQEGNTIILVTHNLEIASCAQRIIRIQDGRVIRDN